ncbi:hypothetical protein H6F42_16270 [Pseudanabaena sp. FACHB-1998]|uniref:hypothetical protein n=1 Tax=Pseudanabaena sp. FACHB-1998 TaxID=2692858 RepID=UPI001681B1EC|nr:hypothetical protein [Pseudanabaena sp. FACHB-1998]MBD2178475.1 hypothetical protein [Pseudanabaena sp. FACHB-1998]
MVDPSQPTYPSDTEKLAVPKELASLFHEIVNLYHQHHNQLVVIDGLNDLITATKGGKNYPLLPNQVSPPLHNYLDNQELESESDFLKSWDDIFNVQVYIDTDIYGELDPRPPALVQIENGNNDGETIIQHTEATEAYVQSWKELAESMSSFPDDLFTRLWTTIEIAKILECSPSSLRRSRRHGRLPLKIKNLILDCISHDGKRSLWFVRPA